MRGIPLREAVLQVRAAERVRFLKHLAGPTLVQLQFSQANDERQISSPAAVRETSVLVIPRNSFSNSTMDQPKTTTKSADRKVWKKPRKLLIVLLPTYKKQGSPQLNIESDPLAVARATWTGMRSRGSALSELR